MAWEPGLAGVYYPLATLFQLGLAGLILSTGPKRPVRVGFAALLGLAGIGTTHLFLETATGAGFPGVTSHVIDTALLWTIAYLALQFPSSAGGTRGERWTRRAWMAALAAVLTAGATTLLDGGALYEALRKPLHELAFAAGAAALAVHLIPRWLELDPGPLKTQTLYAGAGLAMSAAFQAGTRADRLAEPGRIIELILTGVGNAGTWLLVFFTVAAICRLIVGTLRQRTGQAFAFTGLILGATLLGFRANFVSIDPTSEFATQVGRPILFAIAMLRFDLFRIPDSVRRTALPVTMIAFASLSYLVLAAVLQPEGLAAPTLEPIAAVLATLVLATGLVLGRDWFRDAFLEPLDDQAPVEGRIDRYRLALERARAEGTGEAQLDQTRRQLGVSREEHAVLEHVMDEHVLLPASAVRGAASGDLIAGRYEVDRELGRGGHGRALLAWDRQPSAPSCSRRSSGPGRRTPRRASARSSRRSRPPDPSRPTVWLACSTWSRRARACTWSGSSSPGGPSPISSRPRAR